MTTTGAARKSLIFTESRRTPEYLKTFLETHGYQGQVVLFNGTNGGPEATAIYERWVQKKTHTGRSSASSVVAERTARTELLPDAQNLLLPPPAAADAINTQSSPPVIKNHNT